MNKNFLTYFFRFILIVLLQIFVLNKISLWGFVMPVVFISFIFSLPFQTPKWAVILLGFLIGIIIDFFTGIIGIQALAMLIISFIRPFIIRILLRKEREEHLRPILLDMRFFWYFQYAFLLTFIYHSVYFFVDVLSFYNFSHTMLVILSNTVCSLVCIFLIQILFYKSSKRY